LRGKGGSSVRGKPPRNHTRTIGGRRTPPLSDTCMNICIKFGVTGTLGPVYTCITCVTFDIANGDIKLQFILLRHFTFSPIVYPRVSHCLTHSLPRLSVIHSVAPDPSRSHPPFYCRLSAYRCIHPSRFSAIPSPNHSFFPLTPSPPLSPS